MIGMAHFQQCHLPSCKNASRVVVQSQACQPSREFLKELQYICLAKDVWTTVQPRYRSGALCAVNTYSLRWSAHLVIEDTAGEAQHNIRAAAHFAAVPVWAAYAEGYAGPPIVSTLS